MHPLDQAVDLLNQAKSVIKSIEDSHYIDKRALSIAVTHLETAALWVVNARK